MSQKTGNVVRISPENYDTPLPGDRVFEKGGFTGETGRHYFVQFIKGGYAYMQLLKSRKAKIASDLIRMELKVLIETVKNYAVYVERSNDKYEQPSPPA